MGMLLNSQMGGWGAVKRVAFAGTSYANTQVRLALTTSNFTYADANADGSDLRFTATAADAPSYQYLDYWIETWAVGGTSVVWVKVPTATTTQVFLWYRNPAATDKQTAFTSFMNRGFRWESFTGMALAPAATFGGNDLNLQQGDAATQVVAGQSIGTTTVSARWDGWIVPEAVGEYTMGFSDDDGGRAWLAGVQVYNQFADGAAVEYKNTVTWTDLSPKSFRYEWYQNTGNGSYKMGLGARTGRRTNLVTNPSFEVDTAGWALGAGAGGATGGRITTDSFLGAANACFEMVKTTSTDYLTPYTTGVMPVVAGTTYTASAYMKVVAGSGSTYLMRIAWRNAVGAQISVSETNTAVTASWAKYSVSAVAPATAVDAQIVMGAYGATAGTTMRFDAVLFEAAAASSSYIDGSYPQMGWNGTAHQSSSYFLSNSRVNVARNPRAAIDTSGFAALNGSQTLSRRTDDGVVGSTCFETVMDAVGQMGIHQLPIDVPTMTGDPWNFSAWVKSTNDVSTVNIRILFYAADGTTVLLNSPSSPAVALTSAWQRLTHTAAAPAGSAFVRVRISTVSTTVPIGGSLRVTGFLLERTNTLGAYFDGDLAPAAWRGTAHNSFSLQYASDKANLAINPSFTVDLTGWESQDPTFVSIARIATGGVDGGPFIRGTRFLGGGATVQIRQVRDASSMYRCAPGDTHTASGYSRSDSANGVLLTGLRIAYYDAAFAEITATVSATPVVTTSWQRVSIAAAAPANAAYVTMRTTASTSLPTGGTMDWDQMQIERAAAATTYSDGDIAGSSWAGTASGSASLRYIGSTTVTYPFTSSQVFGPQRDPAFPGAIETQSATLGDAPIGLSASIAQDVAIWLDASDTASVIASSGSVSQLSDKSGLARHFAQATPGSRPVTGTRTVNGKNVLDFDGVDDLLLGPSSPIMYPFRPARVFVVFANDASTGGYGVSMGDTSTIGLKDFGVYYHQTLFQIAAPLRGSNVYVSAADSVAKAMVVMAEVAQKASPLVRWIRAGGASVTDSPSTIGTAVEEPSPKFWRVGARGNDTDTGGGYFLNGTFAELLVYERPLSTVEEDAVIAYLRTKWGV